MLKETPDYLKCLPEEARERITNRYLNTNIEVVFYLASVIHQLQAAIERLQETLDRNLSQK